jgi:hypothetical protein
MVIYWLEQCLLGREVHRKAFPTGSSVESVVKLTAAKVLVSVKCFDWLELIVFAMRSLSIKIKICAC